MKIKFTMKAARMNAKLSLAEASKALSVSVDSLISYEKGKTSPNGDTISKMIELYNIPIECLCIRKEEQ